MKNKIPKMICGIIITISIVVIGFFALSPFWFWVSWEIIAAGLVAIGCAGEWYMFLNPAKEGHESHHRHRELQFITAVAIGVTMEFVALSHAILEAVRLERDVADSKVFAAEIGTTNAQLVASNLVFALRVEELRKENAILKTRRITPAQREKFINILKNRPTGPVKIFVGTKDPETDNYASQLRELLDSVGCGVRDGNGIEQIQNLYYKSPIGDPGIDFPFYFILYSPEHEPINWPGFKATFDTNNIVRYQYDPNDVKALPIILIFAFKDIEIIPGLTARTNFIPSFSKSGDWGIFIPQKF